MIFEMADILVKPGMGPQFEAAVTRAVPLFQRAKGCVSMQVQHCIEQPDLFRLVVGWQTLEDHTVHFRSSDDFQEWRRLVGEYFAEPPKVIHTALVVPGF
jgi:heme-degrading monooxygenase HmoA